MTTPNGRVLAAVVAVVALVVAGFVVVYGLTPPSDRPMLFASIGGGWKALTATAATLAAVLAGKSYQGSRVQSAKLDRVERQTNGDLDRRMALIIATELDTRGLIPQQRVDDTGPVVLGPVGEHRAPAAPAGDYS